MSNSQSFVPTTTSSLPRSKEIAQRSAVQAKDLSQRSVAMMIGEYNRLFLDSGPFRAFDAPADLSKLPQMLYGVGFQREFLIFCNNRYEWDFGRLFPALHDGSFTRSPSGAKFSAASGKEVLRSFALVLCVMVEKNWEWQTDGSRAFLRSLEADGLRYVGGQFIETTQGVVQEVKEFSAVEVLLDNSSIPESSILFNHFHSAQRLFASGDYHASVGQWRSFMEALLRGIWKLTKQNRTEFSSRSETPPMKDIFKFLEESAFFTNDEQLAYASQWGFLSAGGHPGIAERDDAHLSMFIALIFGHAALLKLETWAKNGYSHFETR